MSRPSTKTVAVISAIAVGTAVLGTMWFFSDSHQAARAHDDALARWEARQPAAYSFDYSYCSGMCDSCPLHVTVKNHQVTSALPRRDRCSSPDAPTIEVIFAMEKSDRASESTDSFEIRYDPYWGFPAMVEMRCPEGTSDCGVGYQVTNFRRQR